ncbi:MAG: chemotaxis response regulator protein-glutamate methylesterase [Pseudomonadota bacterium]
MKKIRALVVDDSALMRRLLTDILDSDSEIEVVGTAQDAFVARDKIKALNPDVITLDIEMPRMDGLVFLENLMRLRPMPVVMISSLTERGADATLKALDLGAVDFVSKPKVDLANNLDDCSNEIRAKVKIAARVPAHLLSGIAKNIDQSVTQQPGQLCSATSATKQMLSRELIAIGSSTGGTEAVKDVLVDMPPSCPGIVITQHIPPEFSKSFALRLDKCTSLSVCEAQDGQAIYDGHAYVAPGGRHLEVAKQGEKYVCRVSDGERVNRHRPSVDVLFDSVAKVLGEHSIGVILTGMGKDGALGLATMHAAGARTVAQDEESSVVWGMPRAAIELNAVDVVLPLNQIANKLTGFLSGSQMSLSKQQGRKSA